LKVALLLGEVTEAEELSVSEDEINDEIETAILTFGSQAALARQFYSSPEVRRRMANRVLSQKTLDRLIAIAKGEEPPIGEPEKEVEPEEVVEAVDELETGEQEAIAAVEAVTEDIIETPEETVEGAEAEAEAKPEEELEEDNNG
jgi:hypothetical protein